MKAGNESNMIFHSEMMKVAISHAKNAFDAGEFPVGCVIAFEGDIVATGHRRNSCGAVNELDHAEIVALRQLREQQPLIDLGRVTVYSTMEPCLMCFSTLIVNGVKQFVYAYEDAMGGGTNLPLHALAPLYRNVQPTINSGVMRAESLALFKAFFKNRANTYLADSYLAQYTLAQ